MREKCPYSEFFWSVFSHIPTEYGEIRTRITHSIEYADFIKALRNLRETLRNEMFLSVTYKMIYTKPIPKMLYTR